MKKIYILFLILFCSFSVLNSQDFGNWKKENWKQIFDLRKYFDADTLYGTDTLKMLLSIHEFKFCDSLNGVIACSPGMGVFVFKTTDGGFNWNLVLDNGIFNSFGYMQGLSFPSPNIIIVSLRENVIERTLDGGVTWDTLYNNLNCILFEIDFLPNGFGVGKAYDKDGDSTMIVKSTDFGETWSIFENLPDFTYKTHPKIFSDSIISCIVYDAEPRFYYYCISENLGQTWNYYPYYISNDSARLGVEFFLNSEKGWGVLFRHKIEQTGDNIIIKTTDSGKSWIKKLDAWIEPAFTLLNINFIDSLKGISTSRAGKFLYSTDGGENWIKDSSFISEDISEIMTYAAFLSQKRFIISKILGQVFMYDEDGFTNVEEKPTENILTAQVFPNPATNQIEFKLQLNEPQILKFEIFDILGNQVLPKIELFSESPEFSQTIDISNLPTGVYYIVTSANKQKTAMKFIKVE